MRDPYTVLGVKRDANADEIKRAFRKLAKASHPDYNKTDPKAQERFSEINSAYEILGDDAKRKAFDRGEIDAEGKPRASMHPGFDPAGFGGPQGGAGGFRFDFGGGGKGDPRDIFSDIFRQFETGGKEAPRGAHAGQHRRSPIPPGEDVELEAAITLEEVAGGGTRRVTLPDGRTVEVSVPKGVANGATMRLKGQGHPSPFGGPNGDVLVTLRYSRHTLFTLDGADLRIAVPVPIRDAVLGGSVRVPTLQGAVEVTVPAWTSGGKTLRLRGKGLPLKDQTGDLYVTLQIDLGPNDPEIEGFFRRKSG
ncbi:MAG: hypothetical protein FD175_1730 [Beijerinckiaceae bacterium]|nr:MAG: hypothetical protein FD175_1730 [Beijerinckiaceae bacterium]